MFSTLRTRFGIPGVISVMALVFASFGGAYAASNSSDGGKATASAKAKKGPRGPKGATGPAGAQGPAGPAGVSGKDGSNGASGPAGNSVVVTNFSGASEPAGDPCNENGGNTQEVEKSGAKHIICNGEEGAPGADGSPWTLGGTLPEGATETGAWTLGKVTAAAAPIANEGLTVPISFPVPLASELGLLEVHYINKQEEEAVELETNVPSQKCHGSAAAPTADPGNLCIYASVENNFEFNASSTENIEKAGGPNGSFGASTSGSALRFVFANAEAEARGTWAVTAPEP